MLIPDSLIDSNTQYFIAESTKTVDLMDNTKHAPGDEIWMGCGSVSKAGRLCEKTIEVAPTEKGYPCFMVKYATLRIFFSILSGTLISPSKKLPPRNASGACDHVTLFTSWANANFETL
jgi:hypothetical protein